MNIVPVIAIFTKFDDLVAQVSDWNKEEDENRAEAENVVKEKFERPLENTKDQPRHMFVLKVLFYVFLKQCLINIPLAIHEDGGNHQDQVKTLIEKTANSLDVMALKMLFVSIQDNNLELSIKCAIYE